MLQVCVRWFVRRKFYGNVSKCEFTIKFLSHSSWCFCEWKDPSNLWFCFLLPIVSILNACLCYSCGSKCLLNNAHSFGFPDKRCHCW